MTILYDEHDHAHLKAGLVRYKAHYDARIYHWTLIPNHFHISIELPNPEDISSFMARWLGGYARYFCKKYETSGHVWQGRFKSQPVQKEDYLLRCGRYIERNALRARLVKMPWDYEWSSCRYYVFGEDDGLTDEDPFFRGMGKIPGERRRFYMQWLMEGEDEDFRGAEGYIGDGTFKAKLRMYKGRAVGARRGLIPIAVDKVF
jgi:putative transposase